VGCFVCREVTDANNAGIGAPGSVTLTVQNLESTLSTIRLERINDFEFIRGDDRKVLGRVFVPDRCSDLPAT